MAWFRNPPSATAASSVNSSKGADQAFNNTTGSNSFWWSSGYAPQWVRGDFGTAQVANWYSVTPYPSDSNPPTAWTFEGSNDASSWTTLDTRSGVTYPGTNALLPSTQQSNTYTFTNATAYRYYRLNISAPTTGPGGAGIAVVELRVGSGTPTSWLWNNTMPTTTLTGDYTIGVVFKPTQSGNITDFIGYKVSSTGTAVFKVVNSSGTQLATESVAQSSLASNGFYTLALSTPLAVTAGTYYMVTCYYPTNSAYFAGQPATDLTYTDLVIPSNGSVSFNGSTSTIRYSAGNALPTSTAGDSHLVGVVFERPTASAATVTPPVASLTLAAPVPAVGAGTGATVSPPAASLTIAARVPVVTAGTGATVAPPAAALALTAPAPSVIADTGVVVTPPAASLTLAAPVPTVLAGSQAVVAPPAAALSLSALVPTIVTENPPEAGVWREPALCGERWVTSPVIAPPSERARWSEVAECGESMEFDPRAIATPPAVVDAPIKRLGMLMPALSAANPRPVPYQGGFDIERDDIGRLQTIIGGRNVTFLRDVPTTLDRYASEGPMCDTQATVRLPLDPWDELGDDDLAHIDQDAQVDVILVRPDGTTEHKWEGFVAAYDDNTDESSEDYTVQCEGLFMQAAHWPWDVPVIAELRDVGHVVADALNSVPNRRWRKIPRVTTGILTSERGQQGWSTWQFVQTVLGKAWTSDGRQWSLNRVARRTYRITLKASVSAPTFTITKGAPGVAVSLRRDFSTRRDAIFARGYAPDGGFWCGRVFPSLDFGVPPRYPFNDAGRNITVGTRDRDTDTGNGVTVWQRQMRDLGYPVTIDGAMNSNDTKWVYRVQRDKGITVDGSLGPQTWNATFEDNSHDADLTTYRVPLAFNAAAWPWKYTASGARTLKDDRNKTVILHAMPEVDWGTDIKKTSAIAPTQLMLNRDGSAGWTGTVTLRTDPWETGSSRLDIREGHNLLILGHYGGTIVQVASADHGDESSTFAVDTRARDAMSLDAIRDRNREARRDAAGRGNTYDRSSFNNAQIVQYESESKAGFVSRTAVNGNSGLWSVRKAFVSQVGVAKVEFEALHPKAEMVIGIFNRPIRTSILASLAPDPLADDDKWYEHEELLKSKYGLMEVFGSSDNPGGYSPRQKGKGPLTGKLRDEAGLPYDSPYGGFVWVAMFTSRSTWVEGRIFPAVPQ